MLTQQELHNIFLWQPYRDSWAVNRNVIDDGIEHYYGELIRQIRHNKLFSSYYSQDGSMSNYLEFICYPPKKIWYEGNALMLCMSLCAPLAAYGQISFACSPFSCGRGDLFTPESINTITDPSLHEIEMEIRRCVEQYHLTLLDKEFATRLLAPELQEKLLYENLNGANQNLHAIFQWQD